MRLNRLLLEDRGINVAYYMPTYDLIKLRAMIGFEQFFDEAKIPYKTNKSEYTISVENYGSIIFRSYDRPERIIAYEVAHSIVDELDTLKIENARLVWRKIAERNRQKSKIPNSIGCVTTPDMGYNGFIYENWYKKLREGYEVIKASTYDNPFLPDGYVQQILDNYDPILADLYLRGEIVSLNQNKVYHFFNRNKHHTQRTIKDEDKFLHIGLDFNIGGCCASVCLIENNMPIVVDEFISHDTYDFVNNLSRYKGKHITVYPDASGKANKTNASRSDIKIIEDSGYDVDAGQMNPAIRDRVNSVNALLSKDRFLINTDKCPNLTNALEIQGYDDNGEPEKSKTHPAPDDWNDSLGYFIARKWLITRSAFSTTDFFR